MCSHTMRRPEDKSLITFQSSIGVDLCSGHKVTEKANAGTISLAVIAIIVG